MTELSRNGAPAQPDQSADAGRAPASEPHAHERARHHGQITDTRRAEAFADGVFAIVITLLVIDLHPPQTPPGRVLHGLMAQWPAYVAYVTSYLYIAVVWMNHKSTFTHIRHMNRVTHWGNLLILFCTALVPFPTAVISRTMEAENTLDQRVAVALYALIGVMLCASWVLFWHHLARRPELLQDVHRDERFFARETNRAWLGVVLYAVAGVVGYVVGPGVALVILLALPVFYGVTSHGLDGWPSRRRAATDK
jgi:uncharacterized membrane protein